MSINNTSPVIVPPTNPPALRIPADDQTIQQTNAALQALITLLGSPAQDGTIASVLQQLAQFGAQPFVPNTQSASVLEVGPGQTILATPKQAFRVWGGYVAVSARTNNTFTGTAGFYGKIYAQPTGANPALIVSHVELAVANANDKDSGALFVGINGTEMPANSQLVLDLNGGTGLGTTGVLRASANIFYSIP